MDSVKSSKENAIDVAGGSSENTLSRQLYGLTFTSHIETFANVNTQLWNKLRSCPAPTPEPRPLKKGTFDMNASINLKCSGDMSSTQNNLIWSSANSFFRNRQEFACFLEYWTVILISVNWQWSLGKKTSLSKNWDYWKIAENMVKMHNLLNKSCYNPRLQSKSHLSKKLRLLRKTENF